AKAKAKAKAKATKAKAKAYSQAKAKLPRGSGGRSDRTISQSGRGTAKRQAVKTTAVCLSATKLSNDSTSSASPCSAGTYREIAPRRGRACSKCWPGSFAASSARRTAQKCAKGSMASGRLSSCTPCLPVSFISFSGSPACVQCPAGTWSKAGAAKCSKCAAGHVSPAVAAACTSCPAGKFSRPEWFDRMHAVPAAASQLRAASACTRCPSGQFSEEGSKQVQGLPTRHLSLTRRVQPNASSCDRNFALAIRSGMTKCDLCPGGGASWGEPLLQRVLGVLVLLAGPPDCGAPLPLLAEAGRHEGVPRTPPTPGLMSSTEPLVQSRPTLGVFGVATLVMMADEAALLLLLLLLLLCSERLEPGRLSKRALAGGGCSGREGM
uniref:Ephrin_rec_like domain-containing protein n=1 Tax=Macrostomum lignano TaxID=282301 RepID=A0A1I8FHA4_9PLAT